MPLYTDGFQHNYLSQDPLELEASLASTLDAARQDAWRHSPFSSLWRYSQMASVAEQTEGMTGLEEPLTRPGAGMSVARYDQLMSSRYEKYKRAQKSSIWLTQDQAVERIQNAGVDPREIKVSKFGANAYALDYVIEAQRQDEQIRFVQATSSQGLVTGSLEFAVNALTSLADPINLGLAFVPVVSQARYASALNQATTWSKRALIRGRVGAIEGVFGAALVEPIVVAQANQEQLDYGWRDSLMNITLGGALGGGLHMGVGAFADRFGLQFARGPQGLLNDVLEQTDANVRNHADIAAVGQTLDDYNVSAPETILRQTPSYRDPLYPRRAEAPEGMALRMEADGTVRAVQAGDEAHIARNARTRPGGAETPEARAAFDALPEATQQRLIARAALEATEEVPNTARNTTIPLSAGRRSILNVIEEEKGFWATGSKSPSDTRHAMRKLGYQKDAMTDALVGRGGKTLEEMAEVLQRKYDIGDGSVRTMMDLIARDQAERLRLRSMRTQAEMDASVLGSEPGIAFGVQSKTLREATGLREVPSVTRLLERGREAPSPANMDPSSAVEWSENLRAKENLRDWDANAVAKSNRAMDELPVDRTDAELDQAIADLGQEIQQMDEILDIDSTPAIDAADVQIKYAEAYGNAVERTIACALGAS